MFQAVAALRPSAKLAWTACLAAQPLSLRSVFSIRLDSSGLHQADSILRLGSNELIERGSGHRHRVGTDGVEFGGEVASLKYLDDLGIEALDDRPWRLSGRE